MGAAKGHRSDRRRAGTAVVGALAALLAGCSDRPSAGASSQSGSGSSGAAHGDSSTTIASSSATVGMDTSTTPAGSSDGQGSYDDSPPGCAFTCDPDGGVVTIECDLWGQDCPADKKCMPWANDGGGQWNATICAPLDADPHEIGEPCEVEGSAVSGIDNCVRGAMCWAVDARTLQGVCVGLCHGSVELPLCEDPATHCWIGNDGVLPLCLAHCDPVLQDCDAGQACRPADDGAYFGCAPSLESLGQHGDPCEFSDVCAPGLWCADAALVSGCMDVGCCTEFCDLTAAEPDAACVGAADGETCVAWFAPGQAPPGLAHVGMCVVPVP